MDWVYNIYVEITYKYSTVHIYSGYKYFGIIYMYNGYMKV